MKWGRTLSAAAALIASLEAGKAGAATLPPGFQQTTVFWGLTQPTAVRFSPDGRVFVAEKSGRIWIYPSLSAVTPTLFADLSTNVYDYWDRGLLGFALDPNFPATPYVYVLYTYDAPVGGTAPTWNDTCPNPPGASNGCVASGRLSRLTASGNVMTGNEVVLLEAWAQQFPSHSVGDLHFGPDGAMYVSAGEGANFNNVDYGQFGSPPNPLGDPPVPVGGAQTPPDAEGGALRSLSLLRVEGGPVLTNGAILRLDTSGGPLPDNPLAGSADGIAQRIIASGLRNPFRFAIQPGTGSLWIGDVGWNTWEEIDRIGNPTAGVANFGWPCYEGSAPQKNYAPVNLNICQSLYSSPAALSPPFWVYSHSLRVVPGETCPKGTSSISGLAFYDGTGNYPSNYIGALFFADYSRRCAWVMLPDAGGQPDPTRVSTFIADAAAPVDFQLGPGGDIYYVDHRGGTIRRIQYNAPVPVSTATPMSGEAPLTVEFDASGSTPAHPGDTLTYAWDFDGDGQFDDSTLAHPTRVYSIPGTYTARLRVTDNHGESAAADPIFITASDTPPVPVIDSPAPTRTWRVGDLISFAGHATDVQDGPLPASALNWAIILRHCPADCHEHRLETLTGESEGFFSAPDHDYPSSLRLELTATDSQGLTATQSVDLLPQTVTFTFDSSPPGLQLSIGGGGGVTPFSHTVIVGSQNAINAPSPQTLGGTPYRFDSWSDGGEASHIVTAGATRGLLRAVYGAADLSIAATADPAIACPGATVTYRYVVRNAGPTSADNVSLFATLPAAASLVDVVGKGWTCSAESGVACSMSSLAPGNAPAVVVTVTAPETGGTLVSNATASTTTGETNVSNNSATVSATVPSTPIAGNNGPVCAGQTLVLTASGTPGSLYHWTGPSGFSSNVQNPSIPGVTAARAGTYTVTATLSGCTSPPATTVVVVEPKPSADVSAPPSVCPASTENAASVPDAGTGASYTWSISNGTITKGAGTSSIRFSAGPSASDPVVLTATVQNANGCFATSSLSIPITPCPGAFFTIAPCRLVDTRNPTGPLGGPALPAGADRTFRLVGACEIPAAARAVALNLTATEPTAPGSLGLRATGDPAPGAAVLAYSAGETRASNAVVGLSSNGELDVRCDQDVGNVQVILDVVGFFE